MDNPDSKVPPVPRPRTTAATSRIPTAIRRKVPEASYLNIERNVPRETFLHVAEIHSAVSSKTSEQASTSDEPSLEPIDGKKRKRVVRKRSTFVVKKIQDDSDGNFKRPKTPPTPAERKLGSATETLSDNSSPTRIQIGPLPDRNRRRQPKGSATETLSEDSSPAHNPLLTLDTSPKKSNEPSLVPSPPVPLPRTSVSSNNKTSPTCRESPGISGKTQENIIPPDSPSCYTSSSVDYLDTGIIPPSRQKKHKKKRKFKEENQVDVKEDASPPPQIPQRRATCVTVHRCEPLKIRDMYKRPSVRIHFLDTKTRAIRKSSEGKMDVDSLETQPFDPTVHRTLVPTWNEELLLNEPPENIATTDCLVIFELLEMDTNDLIAWAFLRPMAANGKTNLETQLRLQLYKTVESKKLDSSLPKTFQWWIKGKLKPYKSTLFVSLHSIPAELLHKPVNGVAPSQPRKNSNPSRNPSLRKRSMPEEKESEADKELHSAVWSRLPSLSCKLPNKIDRSASTGPDGGISLAYSHSGLLLACHTTSHVTVFTYKGTPYLNLSGHYGLVYGISWSSDDTLLCTASADTTACVWDVKSKLTTPVLKLPHPSYVYCCSWVGRNQIVTGCFDGGVRLWSCFTGPSSYLSDPPIVGHKTRVNSLTRLIQTGARGSFENEASENLVTGDSEGVLIFWKCPENQNESRILKLSRIVKLRELKQKNINKITCHPGGKRILVASRDSTLRMIDLKTTAVIQWFHGGVSQKLHYGSGSAFCGCGSRVLACSEDGRVLVWDANTGERLAFYNQTSVQAIDFHPKENSFALSSYAVGCFPSLVIATYARGETSRGDFILQWAIDYKISKDLKNRSESTKNKKQSVFTTLLQQHKASSKKEKKGLTNGGYTETETPSENKSKSSASSTKAIDNRLSEMIKKMDSILFDNSDCASSRVSTPASIKQF